MMGSEILQNLFDERDALSSMITEINSQNDDQRKQIQTLMERRDAITGAINQIIANRFNGAATELAKQISDLEKLTDQQIFLIKVVKQLLT